MNIRMSADFIACHSQTLPSHPQEVDRGWATPEISRTARDEKRQENGRPVESGAPNLLEWKVLAAPQYIMGCHEKQRSQHIQTSAVGSDQSSLHVLCNLRHQIGVWKVKPCPLRSPLDNGKRNTNYLISCSVQRTNDIIWDLVNLLLCWSVWEEGNGIRKGRPHVAADPNRPASTMCHHMMYTA